MVHAIFYIYQTGGTSATMCTCNCMHQMGKSVVSSFCFPYPCLVSLCYIIHFSPHIVFYEAFCYMSFLPADCQQIFANYSVTITFWSSIFCCCFLFSLAVLVLACYHTYLCVCFCFSLFRTMIKCILQPIY